MGASARLLGTRGPEAALLAGLRASLRCATAAFRSPAACIQHQDVSAVNIPHLSMLGLVLHSAHDAVPPEQHPSVQSWATAVTQPGASSQHCRYGRPSDFGHRLAAGPYLGPHNRAILASHGKTAWRVVWARNLAPSNSRGAHIIQTVGFSSGFNGRPSRLKSESSP